MPSTLMTNTLPGTLDVRFSEEQIQTRIAEMAAEINATYADTKQLIVIAVLKGSFMFLADLIRRIDVPCQVEFVRLASYGAGTQSSGNVGVVDLSLPKLEGEDVLIIEDIIDTGLTLKFFKDYLTSLHHTKSLKIAVMLDKPATRQNEIQADFIGFTVQNEFLIGYGLDYAGAYRNLPYIGVIQP